jgi:lipid-A-disaccharide synthase
VAGQTEGVLASSHFALVASGTATLMAAWYGVPMVIVHRGSWLGYNLAARWVIRTKYLSLVNILAGYELSPELMPWYGNCEQLWRAVEGLLGDVAALKATRQKLLELVKPLGIEGGSAAGNTAELVMQVMRK